MNERGDLRVVRKMMRGRTAAFNRHRVPLIVIVVIAVTFCAPVAIDNAIETTVSQLD